MIQNKNLTVLLTLKGRHFFTLRWLWHANRTKLPFPIYIADGEPNTPISHIMEDPTLFPNLVIQYHRYNDKTFLDFYKKLEDALLKVKTRYVMFADNDDFLFPSGINKSIEFLDQSTDYVCAGGAISHFEICKRNDVFLNLIGPIKALWFQQRKAYQAYDLNDATASERVFEIYRKNLTVWYNVYKTEALHQMASEMVQFNFTELERCELFQKLRAASLGKIKSDRSYISYMRQIGTSSNLAAKGNFFDTLANRKHAEETQLIIKKVASAIACNDDIHLAQLEKKLEDISTEQLRVQLRQLLGWRSSIKSKFKKYIPTMLLQKTRFISDIITKGSNTAAGGSSISRQDLFQQMADSGGPATLLVEQKSDLADMEATLNNKEMLDFIRLHMPIH